MGNKINLQQLAKTLAQKKNLSQKDAETFLKEFFDSIIQNVTTDKLVKIKGLGTFKLIEVLDRESVNVNTGERFIIPGHSKLSFTPDTALKDLINKPFADFQTTIINEGVSLEEMEWTPQPPSEGEAESEEEDNAEQEEPVMPSQTNDENEPEAETIPVQRLVQEPVDQVRVLYGPPPVKPEPEPEIEPEPDPEQELKPEPDEPAEEPKSDGKKPTRPFAKIAAWAAGIMLLCLVCFFAGRSLNQKPSSDVPEVEPQIEAPAEAPVEEIEYAQVPDAEYKIVGTRKTHVMKPGDYLSKIAIEEYGDKEFTKYIIVHNDFPDPDNVPVDMEVKLPELELIK